MYTRRTESLRDSERRRVGEKERMSHIVRREDRGGGGYDMCIQIHRNQGMERYMIGRNCDTSL